MRDSDEELKLRTQITKMRERKRERQRVTGHIGIERKKDKSFNEMLNE